MGILISVLGLFLVFMLLSLIFHPNRKKYQIVADKLPEYENTCAGCGTVFISSVDEKIKKCPNCPTKMCMETAMHVISLGSINEIVRAQPDNIEAKKQQKELEEWLENHTKECANCKEELGC